MKLKLSRIFLQIIWNPAVGDRVLFKKLNKPHYSKIKDINVVGEIQLEDLGWYKSRDLIYVPSKAAYNKVLARLEAMFVFEWGEFTTPYKYKCAVRCHNSLIQIEGTSQDVLTQLLELRGICPPINNAINHLVNQSRGGAGGRIQLQVVQ